MWETSEETSWASVIASQNLSRDNRETISKKPLTRVSKTGAWSPRKEGVGEGLAEKVGKGLAKGWRRVGKGLARGWRRVGKGLADFLAPSNFGIFEAPV